MEKLQIFHQINCKIGFGGFSTVYRVLEEQEKKYYACKIFHERDNEDVLDLLNKEVEIISKLNHPLILRLINKGKITIDGNNSYSMITDFYPNGSLLDIIGLSKEEQEKIGWNDTKKLIFIYMLAIAMSYLHSKQIVHRDFKPGNILINDYLQPIISDFGISKAFDNEIISISGIKGTHLYMAPEIFLDDSCTTAIDVFSFSITILQIITNNKNPYGKFNMNHVLRGKRPIIPSSVPESYKNLINNCWDQDPRKRYTFDQIIDLLENKKSGFLTEKVNKKDFESCVNYCQQFKWQNYKPENEIIPIEQFIHHETTNIKRIRIKEQKISDAEVELYYNEGLKYENGLDDTIIDKKKAAEFYKIAADNGNIDSIFKYGFMSLIGDGIPINKEESANYLKIAANKGHADAMYYYSKMLEKGDNVPVDINQSNVLLENAAFRGQLDAMNDYAMKLYNGDYFQVDKKKAKIILKVAADDGCVNSMHNYAKIIDEDANDKKLNEDEWQQKKIEASTYYKKAADLNNVESMISYGLMLKNGDGIEKDKKEANKYFEMANPRKEKKEWYIMDSIIDDFEFVNTINDHSLTKVMTFNVKSTKQMIIAKFSSKNKVAKLETELTNLLKCSHPSIQKVVGFYKTDDSSAATLFTYFCDKLSLDKYFKSDDFYPAEEKDLKTLKIEEKTLFSAQYIILYGICGAMKYLEENGMFHSNLNPENVLLDKYNHPILNNIIMKDHYTEEEIIDKDLLINYLAPEVISGNKATIKSDVYSFGLIINQLFSGKIPYESIKDKKEIIEKIKKEKQVVSNLVPNFLVEIVENCFKQDPNERLSFSDIFSQLENKFSANKKVQFYKDKIDGLNKCPVTFYRAPKIVVNFPKKNTQISDSSNENNPPMNESSSFLRLDNLEKIFSTVSYDKNIKLVMVYGEYQSGKSTFLRTLTGNGAFSTGNTIDPTTMGIIIDGPYCTRDLVDRIKDDDFKEEFLTGKINSDDDSAIFFIDSQGIGDEKTQEIIGTLSKYLSFFCTLCDICITISKPNEHLDVLTELIKIIRSGQASKKIVMKNDDDNDNDENSNSNDNESFKDITKIIFLIRDLEEADQINNKQEFTRYQKEKLTSAWLSQHKGIQKKYHEQLIKILPLGHQRLNLPAYNCSVWNSIPYIISALNETSNHTKDYIQEKMEFAITFLFSDFFDQFEKQFTKIEDQIHFIFAISLELLKKSIKKYHDNAINKEEAFNEIQTNFYVIKNLIIPFTIGRNDISFYEYNQYSYDLMKDIAAYLAKKIPELKENIFLNFKEFFLNDVLDFVGGGVASGGTAILSTICINLSKKALIEVIKRLIPLLIPGGVVVTIVSVVSSCISVGSFFGWFLNKYFNKLSIVKGILTHEIQISIPFLWERTFTEKESKKLISNLSSPKKFKCISKDVIIVLEDNKSNLMKFVIQSLTGVITNYQNKPTNKKEAISYGPFNPNDLIKRSSRCFPDFESDITKDVYILYLRCYEQSDLDQIKNIQEKTLFFLVSYPLLGIFPSFENIPIYSFDLINRKNKSYSFLTKRICNGFIKTLEISRENINHKIYVLPIEMNSICNLMEVGPLTNRCLRFAFNKLLERKEVEEEKEEE